MKDSFVFYKSFYEAIHKVQDKSLKADIFEAICELALNENVIELDDTVGAIIMNLITPQILANNERYENGKKGGAPKGNQNAKKQLKQPMVDFKNNSKQPNVNVNVNENENVNVNKKENKKEKNVYGEFKNVLLTDDELEKLKQRFPDYELRIEKLSNYIASKGVKYKSHYATILSWARNDKTNVDTLPNWYGKDIQKKEISEDEKRELEEMLKELEE